MVHSIIGNIMDPKWKQSEVCNHSSRNKQNRTLLVIADNTVKSPPLRRKRRQINGAYEGKEFY